MRNLDNLDFNNHIIDIFNIGGTEIIFTETMRNTLIVSTILIIFGIIARIAFSKFSDTPKGFQNALEAGVDMFSGMVNDAVGEKFAFLGNWYFAVFCFILVSNYCGLLGLRNPTADLATTLSLALVTFFLIHFFGITQQKGDYFKGYFDPVAVFAPVNVLGAIATPISLSFRLFGNLLGGSIIMSMIYCVPVFLRIGLPAVLHLYFDIFAGAIQAVIFTMLGLLFISEKLPEH